MFSTTISPHDQFHFEVVTVYPLKEMALSKYWVEAYFFLPANLGMDTQLSPAEEFYGNMQKYIRLQTPQLKLQTIISQEQSPLQKLRAAARQLEELDSEEHRQCYLNRIKIFCSIFKSAVRNEALELNQQPFDRNFLSALACHQRTLATILRQFRQTAILNPARLSSEEPCVFFRHADEFLSLSANKYRFLLWRKAKAAENIAGAQRVKYFLHRLIKREISYRQTCRYPAVQLENSDNSEYLYRENVLKKWMASVLFLHTVRGRDGVLLQNLIFGFAAGIAMAFATGIAMYWQRRTLENVSLTFFFILVVVYMMKDRIKEIGRSYFHTKLKSVIFDYKTSIINNFGRVIGTCRESVGFVQENKIDPAIITARGRHYLGGIENSGYPEHILRYRKYIRLNRRRQCDELLSDFEVNGLVDIMRFNIELFLRHMDDEHREIPFPDTPPEIRTVVAKRRYHVNVILRYRMTGQPDILRKVRLILSRNGIYQIEVQHLVNGVFIA